MVKSALDARPGVPLSVAVTFTTRLPRSTAVGVPLKAPVAGLKVSQEGSGLPSPRVALRVNVWPAASVKRPAGNVKENAVPFVEGWLAMLLTKAGARFVVPGEPISLTLLAATNAPFTPSALRRETLPKLTLAALSKVE
jgi:hypothetical protein